MRNWNKIGGRFSFIIAFLSVILLAYVSAGIDIVGSDIRGVVNIESKDPNTFAPMGEIYTQGNTRVTAISGANVWAKVNATWQNNSLNMAMDGNSSGSLIYRGSEEKFFHIASTLSIKSAGANDLVEASIFKNGKIVNGSIVEFKLAGAGDIGSSAIHVATNMSYGDFLDLYIRNENDADDLEVPYSNLFAMGMPTEEDTTPSGSLPFTVDFTSMPIGYSQDWYNLTNIPTGMFVMNGTNLSRTTYAGCFAYMGIQFGNNSDTDFKLPDLRGRGVLYSNETGTLSLVGSTGGQTNTTDLITHNHNIMYGTAIARQGTGVLYGYVSSIGSGPNNANTDNSGTQTSVSILDPYIILGGKIIRC